MKQFFAMFLFCIAIISCKNYSGETIINFKAKLIDATNQPIRNAKLSIVQGETELFSQQDESFFGISNSDGNVNFNYFYPNSDYRVCVQLESESNPLNYVYFKGKTIDEIDEEYEWNVPTILVLNNEELAPLHIEIVQNATKKLVSMHNSGMYNLKGAFEFDVEPYNQTYYMKKNQSFTLSYQVKDTTTGETQNFTESISITESPITHTITL